MTVSTKGVTAPLPRVDKVSFADPEAPRDNSVLTLTGWDTVSEAAGHLMQAVGSYPERYRVSEFPDAEALANFAKEGEAFMDGK